MTTKLKHKDIEDAAIKLRDLIDQMSP